MYETWAMRERSSNNGMRAAFSIYSRPVYTARISVNTSFRFYYGQSFVLTHITFGQDVQLTILYSLSLRWENKCIGESLELPTTRIDQHLALQPRSYCSYQRKVYLWHRARIIYVWYTDYRLETDSHSYPLASSRRPFSVHEGKRGSTLPKRHLSFICITLS